MLRTYEYLSIRWSLVTFMTRSEEIGGYKRPKNQIVMPWPKIIMIIGHGHEIFGHMVFGIHQIV